jgi:hypothetical protein
LNSQIHVDSFAIPRQQTRQRDSFVSIERQRVVPGAGPAISWKATPVGVESVSLWIKTSCNVYKAQNSAKSLSNSVKPREAALYSKLATRGEETRRRFGPTLRGGYPVGLGKKALTYSSVVIACLSDANRTRRDIRLSRSFDRCRSGRNASSAGRRSWERSRAWPPARSPREGSRT